MIAESLFIYTALVLIPLFFIVFIMGGYYIYIESQLFNKVKKIKPEIIQRSLGLQLYGDYFALLDRDLMKKLYRYFWKKTIPYFLSGGFFSKEKADKHYEDYYNFPEIRKIKNTELNEYIKKMLALHRPFSILTILLIIISIIFYISI